MQSRVSFAPDGSSDEYRGHFYAPSGLYSNDDIDLDDIALGFHVVEEDEDADREHNFLDGGEV